MDREPNLIVYRASAGAGKTFTLTVEFIRRLVANPRFYRHLLAVTFTNKASNEMKERIIGQLYGIASGDPSSDGYLKAVCAGLEADGERADVPYVRERCLEALGNILHDYSFFHIETIDSFFQTLAKGLARELNLAPNISVEIDDVGILDTAVDKMIEELKPDSAVFRWIFEYMQEKIADNKSWNVAGEIKSFGKNIFKEHYIKTEESLRAHLSDAGYMKQLREELRGLQKQFADRLKEIGRDVVAQIEAGGLSAEDFSYKKSGPVGYFYKLAEGKTDDKIYGARVDSARGDSGKWAAKKSPGRAAVEEMAETLLIPKLEEAETLRPQVNYVVTSCSETLRHFNNLFLLDKINSEVRRINEEKNNFILSETVLLLHDIMKGEDASFVFEKMGTMFETIMVDEFQDTSVMQWGILKNLFVECLSKGQDSFIVGDVKQSIYRWRNGDWGILNSMKDRFCGTFPVDLRMLDTNYRSASQVIDFNNMVFPAMVSLLAGVLEGDGDPRADVVRAVYADVQQRCGKGDRREGYVSCNFITPEKGEAYSEIMLEAMHDRIKSLLDSGVKPNDMAVFCRTNDEIADICNYFSEADPELVFVSDEAFRLDYSPAVRLMVAALRYLADAEDKTAVCEMYSLYCICVLGMEVPDYGSNMCVPLKLEEEAGRIRTLSLYEAVEAIYRCLDMDRISGGEAYVFAFFDLVMTFQTDSDTAGFAEFVAQWDDKLHESKIPSGSLDGIRILTVHKSKGLEFHTVIMPFCSWKLEKSGDQIWCHSDESPYSKIDIVPVNYVKRLENSTYAEAYRNERMQQWIDNVNVLYVAFTRASANMIVYGELKESDSDRPSTVAQLLHAVLCGGDSDARTFEYGTLKPSSEKKAEVTSNVFMKPSVSVPVRMCSSRMETAFRQSNESREFVAELSDGAQAVEYIDRGRLYHRLFSTIATAADVSDAVDAMVSEGLLSLAEAEEVELFVTDALENPQAEEWFSGMYRLYNECAILYREDGKTITRRPDRVMTDGSRAIVVDFKFGRRKKVYAGQVKEYVSLLSRMGYEKVEGYLWYVYENEIEQVC